MIKSRFRVVYIYCCSINKLGFIQMALEHRIPMNNVNANDNNNGTLFSIEYWQLKLIVQIKVRQVKSNDMLLNWNELNRINFGMFSLSNRAASVRAAILIYKTFKTLYLYRKQLQRRRANLCADLNLIVYEFFNYAKLNWELKSICTHHEKCTEKSM